MSIILALFPPSLLSIHSLYNNLVDGEYLWHTHDVSNATMGSPSDDHFDKFLRLALMNPRVKHRVRFFVYDGRNKVYSS